MFFSSILIVFFLSLAGMFFIVLRKIPELKSVDVLSLEKNDKPLKEKISEQMSRLNPTKHFNSEKFLRKFFWQLKIILSSGEKRIDKYLHHISHSEKFESNYWKKVRKNKPE